MDKLTALFTPAPHEAPAVGPKNVKHRDENDVAPVVEIQEPAAFPSSVPHVDELGVTSAPLKSAAFFLSTFCKDYSDDFMLCKEDNQDPTACLKEGRRVTRCAQDFFTKMRENCAETFEAHWQCLERQNHRYNKCRPVEWRLNDCVFDKMGLKKELTGPAAKDGYQVHLEKNPWYKAQEG